MLMLIGILILLPKVRLIEFGNLSDNNCRFKFDCYIDLYPQQIVAKY